MRELNLNIGGVGVSPFASLTDCARYILQEIASNRGGFAIAVNAEKVVLCREDAQTKELVEAGTLRYPDGAGVVLAMRAKGIRSARIPGADLWLEILRISRGRRLSVALIGAAPDVLAETQRRLGKDFPHVDICLARDGFSGSQDVAAVAQNIQVADPDLIFVAMGSPRQENLIRQLRIAHPRGYYLGLGGSFDVYSGRKRRAPLWMQNCGLEWTYRFLAEPSRAKREVKRLAFLSLLIRGHL